MTGPFPPEYDYQPIFYNGTRTWDVNCDPDAERETERTTEEPVLEQESDL